MRQPKSRGFPLGLWRLACFHLSKRNWHSVSIWKHVKMDTPQVVFGWNWYLLIRSLEGMVCKIGVLHTHTILRVCKCTPCTRLSAAPGPDLTRSNVDLGQKKDVQSRDLVETHRLFFFLRSSTTIRGQSPGGRTTPTGEGGEIRKTGEGYINRT